MLYVDVNRVALDPDKSLKWNEKAQELLKKLEDARSKEDKHKVIDDNHRFWKLFKEHLKLISYRKCWYTDSVNPASHYHVDHFRPKKKVVNFDKSERDGYWWLAFEVSNFRLSGSIPNTKKGNRFGVKANMVTRKGSIRDELIYFLDPTKPDEVKLINFQEDGEAIESAPEDEAKWEHDRAKYTIEFLDLNNEDLVEARMVEWSITAELIKKTNELIKEYNESPAVGLQSDIDGFKNQLRQRIASCTNLASTNRACLRASGKRWALDLLEENVDVIYCNGR